MIRMAVLYVVGAWLTMQVAEVVIALAHLPESIGPTILAVLAIGFPIALVFSWFYEVTPEGITLEKDVAPGESITHITGRRIDFIVIAMLCAGLVVFAFDKWWPEGPIEQSIAVLAFENLSGDPEQEYFSDGISEELLNLLAKIPELKVISRTSAFSYKGKDVRLTDVARELNVAHILEGSVRKIGNQVRITAQLIETQSDTHVWSQTYERTLDDIFAIQDEIAAKVVGKLKITLLGSPPIVKESQPEAYALILKARHLGRQGSPKDWQEAIALIEQALLIDPSYAVAWDALASIYVNQADNSLRPTDEGYAQARKAANQALALDPLYARAHARLGWIAVHHQGDLAAAAKHYERALALEPTSTSIIFSAASLAESLGRLEMTIALEEYALARDPLDPVANNNQGDSYLSAGRFDDAIASFRTALALSPSYVGAKYRVGVALLLKGEPESAMISMEQEGFEAWRLIGLAMAHHALDQASASDAALSELIQKYEQDAAYNIAYVFAFRAEADRAFEWLRKAVIYNDPGLAEIANEPLFANIKSDPRWATFLESVGKAPEQLAAIEFNVSLP
ncbi:MAG: tetratricopeptide repeat protein [Gammaproteobacteria bacterium]|nr:tetratricopeptide repeat protein [Gammaproteobacteria bacterium]